MLSNLVAEVLNHEYQAGGDTATLRRVTVALARLIEETVPSHLVADVLNCEDQAGGDTATLCRVTVALARLIEDPRERAAFFDVADLI